MRKHEPLSIELEELKQAQNATFYTIVAENYFDCPISTTLIQNATITPTGQTCSYKDISTAIETSGKSPFSQKALTITELRHNSLVERIISENSLVSTNEEGKRVFSIDSQLLKNPSTNKFFKHPVVDEKGDTIEGESDTPYPNLVIKNLIANLTKSHQALIQPPSKDPSDASNESGSEIEDEAQTPEESKAEPQSPVGSQIEGDGEFPPAQQEDVPIPDPEELNAPFVDEELAEAGPLVANNNRPEPPDRRCMDCSWRDVNEYAGAGAAILCAGTGIWGLFRFFTWLFSGPIWQATIILDPPARQFCLTNQQRRVISINDYQFTLNADIVSGNLEGELYPPGTSHKSNLQPGIGYIHTFTLPYSHKMAHRQQSCLNYHFDPATTMGPLKGIGNIPAEGGVLVDGDPVTHYQSDEKFKPLNTPFSIVYDGRSPFPGTKANQLNFLSELGVDSAGNLFSMNSIFDNLFFPMAQNVTQNYPHVKPMLIIGNTDQFDSIWNTILANTTTRGNFARNLLGTVQQFYFKGISLQLPANANINVTFFQELRDVFDSKYEIELVVQSSQQAIKKVAPADWYALSKLVDRLIAAGLYHGPTDSLSNFQRPLSDPNSLDSISGAMNTFSSCFPTQKLGFSVYGSGQSMTITGGLGASKMGLWQPLVVNGTTSSFNYRDIIRGNLPEGVVLTPTELMIAYPQQKSPWGYLPPETVFTYSDPGSSYAAAEFACQQGYSIQLDKLSDDLQLGDPKYPDSSLVTSINNGLSCTQVTNSPAKSGAIIPPQFIQQLCVFGQSFAAAILFTLSYIASKRLAHKEDKSRTRQLKTHGPKVVVIAVAYTTGLPVTMPLIGYALQGVGIAEDKACNISAGISGLLFTAQLLTELFSAFTTAPTVMVAAGNAFIAVTSLASSVGIAVLGATAAAIVIKEAPKVFSAASGSHLFAKIKSLPQSLSTLSFAPKR